MAVASQKRTPSGMFSVNNWSTTKNFSTGIQGDSNSSSIDGAVTQEISWRRQLVCVQVLSSQSSFQHSLTITPITTSSNASELIPESSVSLNVHIAMQIFKVITIAFTMRMLHYHQIPPWRKMMHFPTTKPHPSSRLNNSTTTHNWIIKLLFCCALHG